MDRAKKYKNLQVLIIINAILYLFSIPSDMPIVYENTLAIINFMLTLALSIKTYQANIVGIALYFFIIAIYYNPSLFLMHKMQTPSALDVIVGISFFVIALCWNYILGDIKNK